MREVLEAQRLPVHALIASLLLHGAVLAKAMWPHAAEVVQAIAEPIAIEASVVDLPLPSPPPADANAPAAAAAVKAPLPVAHARSPVVAAAPAIEVHEPANGAPVEPASVAAPRFVLPGSISFASTARPAQPPGGGQVVGAAPSGGPGAVLDENQVSARGRLLSSAPAVYPADARLAEIEGDVVVELVVDVTGRVIDAHSITRLGYGLEAAATTAVRAYRFQPALKDGVPVPVRMRWTVEFRLR